MMRRTLGVLLFIACTGGFGLGLASAGPYFQIRAVDIPYRNVGVEAFYEQFNLDIDSPVANDELFVELTPHLPEGWLSQFCVSSNGSCFLYSHAITIPADGHERLQIDFVLPLSHEPGMGWIDVRIYRLNDPTTFHEISFALGYGVTVPVSRFTYSSNNVFAQANPNETVELRGVIRSLDNFDDELLVTVEGHMPSTWFAQFCQTSTGVCYIGNATIPFPALAIDTLRVDFFCFDPNPAIGNFRIRVQSAANPAVWVAIPFRVRTGEIAADAQDGQMPDRLSASIAPNPVQQAAEIRLDLARPADARLSIVDIGGRTVYRLGLPGLDAGTHRIPWDATDDIGRPLPNGTYFYRVTGAGDQTSGKLTIRR
jgi:hypothetical protein